ncbi:MAG: hypothetical protein ACK4VK_00660 [Aquificaceae bacterium]
MYKLKIAEIRDAIKFINILTDKVDGVKRYKPELTLPVDKEAFISVETALVNKSVKGTSEKPLIFLFYKSIGKLISWKNLPRLSY